MRLFPRRFIKGLIALIPAMLVLVSFVERSYFEATLGEEIRFAARSAGNAGWDPKDDGGGVEAIPGHGRLTGEEIRSSFRETGHRTGPVT